MKPHRRPRPSDPSFPIPAARSRRGTSSSSTPSSLSSARLRKIKNKILSLCSGVGLPRPVLKRELHGIPESEWTRALNELLHEPNPKLHEFRSGMGTETGTGTDASPAASSPAVSGIGAVPGNGAGGGTSFLLAVEESLVSRYRGLGSRDVMVLRFIESHGNRGVWLGPIKFRTKLPPREIQACLKNLLSRDLIKEVKVRHGRARKVYMGFHEIPDEKLTGGVWYSDISEFEAELVERLREACTRFLAGRIRASVPEIHEFLKTNEQMPAKIGVNEIRTVLESLVLDGEIQKVGTSEYRASGLAELGEIGNPFMDVPCSICPVFSVCFQNGNVSPKTCVYMQEWERF